MVKLYGQFSFCYLENMLKDRLSKTSDWQFHKWFFGPETFSGFSRNGQDCSRNNENFSLADGNEGETEVV